MEANMHVSKSLVIVAGIPAYNEEKTIAQVIINAQKYAHKVIVCDDGSADLTGEIASRLGAIVVTHEKNLGYGAALQSIFKCAKDLNADVLVTFDSDGQHDPSEIPLLVEPIKNGAADVVLGSRFLAEAGISDMPRYRKFGIKVITKLSGSSVMNSVSDAQSGFRAYSKVAIGRLGSFTDNGMGASLELLLVIKKAGLKVQEVPISCKYSDTLGVKTSTKNPIGHGIGLVAAIIRLVVEERPLLFMGVPGMIVLFVGALFGVWMMDIYTNGHHIVTNIALASIGFLFLGCFMISTSITLYAIARISKKIVKT